MKTLLHWIRAFFAAFAAPTTLVTEKETVPIEKHLRTDLVAGGTLADPVEQQRIAPHSHIICGMGSGGPEDVNTYALFDKLPQAERDRIKASMKGTRKGIPVADMDSVIDSQAEARREPVQYEDTVRRNYERSPTDGRMKLKE